MSFKRKPLDIICMSLIYIFHFIKFILILTFNFESKNLSKNVKIILFLLMIIHPYMFYITYVDMKDTEKFHNLYEYTNFEGSKRMILIYIVHMIIPLFILCFVCC